MAQIWNAQTATLHLPDELDFSSLASWVKQHKVLKLPVERIDFSALKETDSSVLSLLVFLAAELQQRQPSSRIEVVNMPSQLKTLVELYDMHSIFRYSANESVDESVATSANESVDESVATSAKVSVHASVNASAE